MQLTIGISRNPPNTLATTSTFKLPHTYIVSAAFDYSKLILRDHGPSYASDMMWEWDTFRNLQRCLGGIVIIDNRITEEECREIGGIVKLNPGTLFCFTLIDPYYEWETTNVYIKTVFDLKHLENVVFLSKYGPKELVKDLDDATGNRKLVVVPYPYRSGLSEPINFVARKHKLVVSGNMHSAVYPLRVAVRKQARWNPLMWGKTECLPHPGYPDIGQRRIHSIIGDAYINYLSGFTLMLVCPSRCSLEFLKYSECAYAGCVPVGESPATFDERLKECVLEVNPRNLSGSLRALFKIPLPDLERRALEFRSRLQESRSPTVLNEKLNGFLERLIAARAVSRRVESQEYQS